jgi:hypothetical protein
MVVGYFRLYRIEYLKTYFNNIIHKFRYGAVTV